MTSRGLVASARRFHQSSDAVAVLVGRALRATDCYRRVWAMVNRTFRTGYNRRRIRRVMQGLGLMLPRRVHWRHGRPHLG